MVEKMKKITIYRVLTILNLLVFLCVLLLSWFINKPSSIDNVWFPALLLVVSSSLFIKYAVFRSGNILWFALVLFGISLFYIGSNLTRINSGFWPMYFLIPSVVSFLLAVAGKSLWQMCLAIGFLFIGTPLFLISFSLVRVWLFVIIYPVCLVVGLVVINFVFNFWRGVYGKI